MLDRVSTFSDPEIVDLLKTRFVPVAVDAWYMNRKKDDEGEFYRKVVTQDGGRKDLSRSTQGRYTMSADGKLLGFNNNRSTERVKQLLQKTLQGFRQGDVAPLDAAKKHAPYDRTPKEGTLVVNVNSKVLGGADGTANKWGQLFQAALGEDHLWIRKDEADELAKGALPVSLKRRIARYHLEDNTRGEPNMWRHEDVRKLEMTLAAGKLTGNVHLETADGRRGYQAELLGFVDSKDGKVSRFDVVARGEYWGHGTYTGNSAPKGRFPLAVAFRLSDGTREADKVPPQGSRDLNGYLR